MTEVVVEEGGFSIGSTMICTEESLGIVTEERPLVIVTLSALEFIVQVIGYVIPLYTTWHSDIEEEEMVAVEGICTTIAPVGGI